MIFCKLCFWTKKWHPHFSIRPILVRRSNFLSNFVLSEEIRNCGKKLLKKKFQVGMIALMTERTFYIDKTLFQYCYKGASVFTKICRAVAWTIAKTWNCFNWAAHWQRLSIIEKPKNFIYEKLFSLHLFWFWLRREFCSFRLLFYPLQRFSLYTFCSFIRRLLNSQNKLSTPVDVLLYSFSQTSCCRMRD